MVCPNAYSGCADRDHRTTGVRTIGRRAWPAFNRGSRRYYLPRHTGIDTAAAAGQEAHPVIADNEELVLIVEDDEDVRTNTVMMVRELGYDVLQASDGNAALRVLETQPAVRLLFTDVGLPGGLNGRQLAEKARQLRPDLVVLFTSGYARNAIVHHGRLDPGVEMIGKPFTYAALGAKIRKVLDKPPEQPEVPAIASKLTGPSRWEAAIVDPMDVVSMISF